MNQPIQNVVRLAGAVLLGLLLSALPAAAQDTGTDPAAGLEGEVFEGEVRVSEVLLDVVVTDKQGNVVVGLGPDDFVVREDGEPVEVESVTFYSSSVPDPSVLEMREEGVRVDPAPEDRYFILFFDSVRKYPDANLLQQQMQAGRDARDWVRQDLAPSDWVAVLGYDRSLDVYTDFTRDRQRLENAIARAAAGREGLGNWPSRQKDEGPSLLDDLPEGRKLVGETTRIYHALEVVAEAAGDVRGRKNLVYVGLGFGDINSLGLYERDERYYPDMIRALNDNNVALYTLDVTPPEVDHTFEQALNDLARDTGGEYYPFFTSFNTPLRQVAKQTSGYYLLSYRSPHPADESGYQEVDVDVKDPDLRVRAREGYLY